jgi:hypothetical protein
MVKKRRAIRVRYTGRAGEREIGKYRWNLENGYVCKVDDAETLMNLATYPRSEFELVDKITLEEIEAWINSQQTGNDG